MKVSVVIPCRNAARTIGRQLEALGRERWADGFEVIVVDNQSTDGSASIVSNYADRLPSLRVVPATARRGAGYARNVGVSASTADAVVFCDADDEVGPGWLTAMAHALCEHDFVACRIDLDKLNEARIVGSWGHPQSRGLQRMPYPPYLPHAGGGTLGVKRWLHDAAGGFDEHFRSVEDTHYCLKIQLAGHALHFVPEAVVHVRVRGKLRDVFRQGCSWGRYSVRLYRASRALGTNPLPNPCRLGFDAWRSIVLSMPSVRAERFRRTWVFQLGYRIGRLLGSIRERMLAP